MDGIFRALGFDSKPVYAERIPESLKASDFNVHEVSVLDTLEERYDLTWESIVFKERGSCRPSAMIACLMRHLKCSVKSVEDIEIS